MKKITFKASLIVALGMFALTTNAQQKQSGTKKFGKPFTAASNYCGTQEYEEQLRTNDPKRASLTEFEAWLAPKVAEAKAKRLQKDGQGTNAVVTIPVVFHVIHNGDAIGENENLSEEQLLSQIRVLNEDYRRAAGTPGFNETAVGADMEIEFCLAKRTPNGLPSTGINRYNLGDDNGWLQEEVEIIKTQTQWDPSKYLNIWTLDDIYIAGGYLAGYAQFPTESGLSGLAGQTATANTDGVALGARFVGSEQYYPEGTYDAVRNMGRSASHEVGHFFGLRHIWGDTADCTGTDYCNDTPFALAATQGCPEGPVDTCPQQPGNDMIENYMDYTNDACLNIFTQNQKDRMQAVLAASPRRKSLTTADSCTLGTASLNNDGAIFMLPISTNCANTFNPVLSFANTGSNEITSAVITYKVDSNTTATYNWTGSLAANTDARIELPEIAVHGNGTHTFTATIVSVNGGTDALTTNNTRTSEFEYDAVEADAIFDTETVKITVQPDAYGSEIQWFLFDSNQSVLAYGLGYEDTEEGPLPAPDVQTVEVDSNACYAFIIIDMGQDGICCDYGNGFYKLETSNGTVIAQGGNYALVDQKLFGINLVLGNKNIEKTNSILLYPNPANSILNIATSNAADMPESYVVYNSLGQIMSSGNITSAIQTLDIARYAQGVYFVKLAKGSETKTLQFIKN